MKTCPTALIRYDGFSVPDGDGNELLPYSSLIVEWDAKLGLDSWPTLYSALPPQRPGTYALRASLGAGKRDSSLWPRKALLFLAVKKEESGTRLSFTPLWKTGIQYFFQWQA